MGEDDDAVKGLFVSTGHYDVMNVCEWRSMPYKE